MDVCAMPGDADLDLDLSQLRLSAVVRAEQRFLLQTRGGTGRYTSDGRLVGTDEERIVSEAEAALRAGPGVEPPRVPPLWDGRAARRILDALLERTRELRAA